jgi:molybdopterin-guanine dinucleotide biosynthesis protein A
VILGAVLAGGRSSRFGSDKALAVWRGQPLIAHVVARLASVADAVIVCGRAHDGVTSIPDRPVAGLGPLGGLNAALHHAAAHCFGRVLTASCDTPVLDDALLAALSAADDACLGSLPVIGIWRSAHAAALDAHLVEHNSRSMRGWATRIGAEMLDLPAPPNVNRPEDLARLDPPDRADR